MDFLHCLMVSYHSHRKIKAQSTIAGSTSCILTSGSWPSFNGQLDSSALWYPPRLVAVQLLTITATGKVVPHFQKCERYRKTTCTYCPASVTATWVALAIKIQQVSQLFHQGKQ